MMALMVYLAINLPSTIWWLIQIKLEILAQIAPAVMLGIHVKALRTQDVMAGLLVGVGITLLFLLTPLPSKPFGFHAGVLALGINFTVVWGLHLYRSRER